MKNIIYLIFIIIIYCSCEPARTIPDIVETAYIKATISNPKDTLNLNDKLDITISIPTELQTQNNTTYTLTKNNITNILGSLKIIRNSGYDTTDGGILHSYNGFYQNGEWRAYNYVDFSALSPSTQVISSSLKDNGYYSLCFIYPIDIKLKDGENEVLIKLYIDFDVPNDHSDMIKSKFPKMIPAIDKYKSDKLGFYAFYVK